MGASESSLPLVSVVLCTYNDERYIAQTMESVLGQTYKEFEFIIWNDGSKDETESIIKSFSDPRIRYFYHVNTGLGMALSLACQEAKGKYIARIDGDDICIPNRFEREVLFLETHPECVLVSSSVIYIDENAEMLGRSFPWTWNRNIKKKINIVHPASMYRLEDYKKTCGYLNVLGCEDRILWSKLKKHGSFHIIQEPLIKYRLITTSLSHYISTSDSYTKMLEIIRKKMELEKDVCNDDIIVQNNIYQLSRAKTIKKEKYRYKKSIDEILFSLLNFIIPEKMAESSVVFLKNIYALLRY